MSGARSSCFAFRLAPETMKFAIYSLMFFLMAFDWVDDPFFGYKDISSGQPAVSSFTSEDQGQAVLDLHHHICFVEPATACLLDCLVNQVESVVLPFFEPVRSIYVFMSIRR